MQGVDVVLVVIERYRHGIVIRWWKWNIYGSSYKGACICLSWKQIELLICLCRWCVSLQATYNQLRGKNILHIVTICWWRYDLINYRRKITRKRSTSCCVGYFASVRDEASQDLVPLGVGNQGGVCSGWQILIKIPKLLSNCDHLRISPRKGCGLLRNSHILTN